MLSCIWVLGFEPRSDKCCNFPVFLHLISQNQKNRARIEINKEEYFVAQFGSRSDVQDTVIRPLLYLIFILLMSVVDIQTGVQIFAKPSCKVLVFLNLWPFILLSRKIDPLNFSDDVLSVIYNVSFVLSRFFFSRPLLPTPVSRFSVEVVNSF